jgi:acetylornithine deacetylase/succinyl-diaminopimelate desuccinylase family protein
VIDRHALAERLFAILRDLVAIPSPFPPGDTAAIAAFAAGFLGRLGYRVDLPSRKPGIANVVARRGAGPRSVVFNAHADTVGIGERAAWSTDPLAATLRDGRVYGLGACNCKSAMAVHLWLAEEIAHRGGPTDGEIVFTFVGDEENLGPEGLAYLREAGAVRPTTLIVAAQTRNRLVTEERGVMWVRVSARGKAAHAGAPDTGDSAILRMHRVIAAIERDLAPRLRGRRSASGQQSTLSIGRIHGGENTNVVPDRCAIEIDRRILPDEDFDAALDELRRTVDTAREPAGTLSVELLTGTPGFSALEDGAGVRAFRESIAAVTGRPPERLNVVGASDGRYFARDPVEIIVFGPGDGVDSHQPDESVPLDELVDAALIQAGVVARLLGIRVEST